MLIFPAGGMMYWSTHDIAPIKVGTSNQDNIIRLRQKEYSNVTAYAVSATSYALLSNMAVNFDERDANAMQRFLQEQHMWIGGFASTMVRRCCDDLLMYIAKITICKFEQLVGLWHFFTF